MDKKLFLAMFFGFMIFSFLILTSLFNSIYDKELYYELQKRNGVLIHFNESLAKEKNNELVSFFKDKEELDLTFFSEKEISHLEDVKRIFSFLKIIYWILIVFLFLGLAYLYFNKNLLQNLIDSLLMNVIFCILLALISYTFPFNLLFEKMHRLLFPQGNYAFDPLTSNLINLFPEGFFIGFFNIIIFTFIIYESIIIVLILGFYINKNKKVFKG